MRKAPLRPALVLSAVVEAGRAFLPDCGAGASGVLVETLGAWTGAAALDRPGVGSDTYLAASWERR